MCWFVGMGIGFYVVIEYDDIGVVICDWVVD